MFSINPAAPTRLVADAASAAAELKFVMQSVQTTFGPGTPALKLDQISECVRKLMDALAAISTDAPAGTTLSAYPNTRPVVSRTDPVRTDEICARMQRA